jgi:hypothetical protein
VILVNNHMRGAKRGVVALVGLLRGAHCRLLVVAACGVMGLLASFAAQPALALTGKPQWTVTSVSRPTNFAPGDESGDNAYVVTVTNTGGTSTDGSPVTITDELPQGLELAPVGASGEDELAVYQKLPSAKLSCVLRTCTYEGVVVPDDTLVLKFPVDVKLTGSSLVTNVVRVAGGGALDSAVETPTTISAAPASFGVSPGGATMALSTTQAGAHSDITTSIAFNTVNAEGGLAGDPKDIVDDLPPGLAGDLVDTPSCSAALFSLTACPIGTQIGVTTATLASGPGGTVNGSYTFPVYNLAPNPGEVAKFGFLVLGNFGIQAGLSVRSGDYGLRVIFPNTKSAGPTDLENASLTIWGVPADPIHDPLRWKPEGVPPQGKFGTSSDAPVAPFATNPTLCETKPTDAVISVTSWERPDRQVEARMPFGPITGCDRLALPSTLTVEPTTERAEAPTGLNVKLGVHQTYDNPYGLATSTLKKAVVVLPEGMTVNPSAGAGLGACTLAEYEEEAIQPMPGSGCPNDSKLGSVKIQSPSLKEEATGSVYIAEPYKNRFGSLLALYVVARFPDRGILVKAAGEVTADPLTGRLVTTFDDLPPLPFTTFTFSFRQGETSPLVTPSACGSYTATVELNPWSEPEAALTDFVPSFAITNGFDGGSCPPGGVPPFAPDVSAGTLDNSAGSYSPLDLRVTRNDGEQEITRFSSNLPAGLTANLSGVSFCSDASIELAKKKTGALEEEEPSCPVSSQIGHTLVGAGVGSVLAWAPGRVYLAGAYNGAPLSIVAITSAKVGPFDLGTVVVREALKIDPLTAAVTVDASASDPIPHIIEGIVIHVRDIRVYVDRPGFTLNPTSCNPMVFSATVTGSGANSATPSDDVPVTIADRFQASDCQNLKFKPAFRVSTSGRTSRRNGASLIAKLAYPNAPQGSQANIRSVKVDLPKQLPSRLTTLQKACPDNVFNVNPAACPPASRVGQAVARTPILPVPLTGPAYFVSHGGTKFPELIVVLQGYGITIDLHGETFISKQGITSSTFRTVPDDPIGSFELTLPDGPGSALAANGNLCKSKLRMPTAFTAQNGMVVHQSTPIAVTGCVKAKVKKIGHSHVHGKGARTQMK